jgi:cbb3-type cytochrome oxidase subunit 3
MFAQIFVPLFFLVLIAGCVALLRSSSKQERLREGPRDLRRADDAERAEPYDSEKAYRAAQDAANWASGPQQ